MCPCLSEQTVEPFPALVVLGVEPDDPDGVQQAGHQGRDVLGLSIHQLLARLTQQRDELETVLSFLMALLKKMGTYKGNINYN